MRIVKRLYQILAFFSMYLNCDKTGAFFIFKTNVVHIMNTAIEKKNLFGCQMNMWSSTDRVLTMTKCNINGR